MFVVSPLFLSLFHLNLNNSIKFYLSTVSIDESQLESPPLTQEKVLELIEQAYPNPITAEDLAKYVLQV